MSKVLLSNGRLIIMAATSLLFSVSAYAGSVENAVNQSSPEPSKRASYGHFPSSLSVAGKRYKRLTGRALRQAVVGKLVCPDTACDGIGGAAEHFYANGNYGISGDRWDDGGTFSIISGVVIVTVGDRAPEGYAFYRSDDGTMRQAWHRPPGGVQSSKVYVRVIEQSSP